ncbi:MAG: HlyD family secretion protein, partial [Gemmatimonadota bacterium]|nr:HlyD family secretion protein [Gemmatimonadota bacterium]
CRQRPHAMNPHLLPAALALDSVECLTASHHARGQAVYLAILGTLAIAGGALPFVTVSVSVPAAGIIRPAVDKHELRPLVGGVVAEVRAREGQQLAAGDTIIVLRAPSIDERASLLRAQLAEQSGNVGDLEQLVARPTRAGVSHALVRTPRYLRELTQLRAELGESDLALTRATSDLRRARDLRAKGFAAAAELEERELAVAGARSREQLLLERHAVDWQSALAVARDALAQQRSALEQIEVERSHYAIRAPVAGTLEQLGGVSPESFVQAGETLGVVSPDSPLLGEVWVTPHDIGMLRVGMHVRLLIDAFNYTEWGVANGRIAEIASDFQLVNQQPAFRVRVSLDQSHLALRGGLRGALKKGMTFRARFRVTDRTLFRLLFDGVEDWLGAAALSSG